MNTCVVCGITAEQADYGVLTDITISIAFGEEGQAIITKFVCDDHLAEYTDIFEGMGFSDHRHGGINFLEDTTCAGAENPANCSQLDETKDLDNAGRGDYHSGAEIYNLDAYRKGVQK